MKIVVKTERIEDIKTDAIAIGLFEKQGIERYKGLDRAADGLISILIKRGEFKGKADEMLFLISPAGLKAKRMLLLGLGVKEKFTIDKLRQASAKAGQEMRSKGLKNFAMPVLSIQEDKKRIGQAIAEGLLLGLYQFEEYKTEKKEEKKIDNVIIAVEKREDEEKIKKGVKVGEILSEANNFTRNLVNRPSNDKTPIMLADEARRMAKRYGLSCRVLDEREIKRLKMGGLIGVSKGSKEPPRFIILEHNRNKKGLDTIVIIGKAITFDSGGISIKPSENMEKMKYDMSGGAAVMGAMMTAAGLKLPLHIVGLIPATENLPSGTAQKPGDVVRMIDGKTVEIISTDAEGRMILGDALGYAKRYKPKAVIDLATLTGACVIALGNDAIGMMGTDDKLKERIKRAGELSYERVWELPLWEEYGELIKSDIADMKNVGGRPAGTITAGYFLSRFIEGSPWVHLDIAGTAWEEKGSPYKPKGATGVGVRLLSELFLNWK
ncbi:MAG: leucyl aminopeptidase [Nitrospirae bacterium RBG_19FT_COMBO_42_15]|nr:MAG: leucyl aminopeptidase [Nitrospirae bacterium RBG_19FT_COMBO_42_15]